MDLGDVLKVDDKKNFQDWISIFSKKELKNDF